MRHVPAFVWGHVLGALLLGFVGGAFLDLWAVAAFSGTMAAAAAVSALLCWRWPGFAGPGWQLWLIGWLANPLFLTAGFFAVQDFRCFVGTRTGWGCLLADLEPMVMGVCLVPPLIGLATRGIAGRIARMPG